MGPEPVDVVVNHDQTGKKLDAVKLYLKNSDGTQGPLVSRVELDYDWSLREKFSSSMCYLGAPCPDGSTEQGSLTLKSVSTYGINDQLVAPPYLFQYAGGQLSGSDLNPTWSRYLFDEWGSYRSWENLNDWGIGKTDTPQQQDQADLAAAWSLTRITTPTGALITIDYESDDYFYVGTHLPAHEATSWEMSPASGSSNSRVVTDRIFYGGNFAVSDSIFVESEYVYEAVPRSEPWGEAAPGTPSEKGGSRVFGEWVTIDEKFADGSVRIDEEITFCPDQAVSGCGPRPDSLYIYLSLKHRHFASSYPPEVYGGGVRVKSISTRHGVGEYSTTYSYDLPNGRSSGVATALNSPTEFYAWTLESPTAVAEALGREKGYVDNMYAARPARYGKSAPSVVYSRVRVENATNDESSGYTDYEFSAEEGMVGYPVATTYYEKVGGNYRASKREETVYAFSSDLQNVARIVRPGAQPSSVPSVMSSNVEVGVTQQKYEYEVESESSGTSSSRIDRTYDNVFVVGTRSIEYAYEANGQASSRISEARMTGFDALTGTPTETAQAHEDGGVSYARTVPAYWLYPDLYDENMLSQQGMQLEYLDRSRVFDVSTLKSYTYPDQHVISASLTTWSPSLPVLDVSSGTASVPEPGQQVWRMNDTYVYDQGFRNADGTRMSYTSPSTTLLNYEGLDYRSQAAGAPWRMTSNVTTYDRYSHPVESVSRDGSYTVSFYNADESLPLAIATRARLDEIIHVPFKAGEPLRIGTQTCSASECTVQGRRTAYLLTGTKTWSTPSAAKTYTVEVVLKPEDGSSGINLQIGGQTRHATPSGTTWWYPVRIRGVAANTAVQFSANGSGVQLDYLRIYPDEARMQHFDYDALTRQVTVMTDANMNSRFFEYDDAGRLIRVRDLDEAVVQQHQYVYARFQDNALKPEVYFPGQVDAYVVEGTPLGRTGQSHTYELRPLTGAGSTQCTWYSRFDPSELFRLSRDWDPLGAGVSQSITFPATEGTLEIRCDVSIGGTTQTYRTQTTIVQGS